MATVIKFESPVTRRIEKINKEIEHIGDSAKAKVLQEQLMTENGKISHIRKEPRQQKIFWIR